MTDRTPTAAAGARPNLIDQSLRSYLQRLEESGGMVRIEKEVEPAENMAALDWKIYDAHGKGSLFTNIKGHADWRACSQILADRGKWSMALGMEEDGLLSGISRRLQTPVEPVMQDASEAPCKEIVLTGDKASLLDIPVVTQSEEDGGPFIPAGMAIVRDPDTGIRNMSIHRMQVFDAKTSGFIMLPRQARRIYDKYVARGENMPVAIAIGAHPAIVFGSAFTTTFGVDELAVAGGLLGDAVRLVKAETVDVEVPADAEIILEGEILAGETHPEGPYGEVPGTYCDAGESEVFRLKAITRRRDPIYYALHCGAPVTDTQATTGLGIEIGTWEHLTKVEGGLDLLDVRCLPAGGMMMLVVKLRPRVEGQAKTALMAALSGPYLHPKLAIAVDDDIDASDLRQVMWSMTTRVHAEKDISFIHNTRTFALDKVSPVAEDGNPFERIGTKWLIDATKPALSHPDQRSRFTRAIPKNFDSVELEDFLPPEMFG
jgi:2,5-furandicarboxylate decarboxylase 1